MKKIVAITGQSNTFKSSIFESVIKEISDITPTHVPMHYTSRSLTRKNDSFYVEKKEVLNKQIFINSGSENHEYGIINDDKLADESIISFIIPSLKDIPLLRLMEKNKMNPFSMILIVLYSSNIEQRILKCSKYSLEEKNYRIKENIQDFKKYIARYDDLIFDVETNDLNKIEHKIIASIMGGSRC